MKLLQEKKSRTKKLHKGGTLSLIKRKLTNRIIEEIHQIDGSESVDYNKPHLKQIIDILNTMVNNQIPLDMHYTGKIPTIGQNDRPLRSILFSYFNELPKVQTKYKNKIEQVYIELFTIFLIGFINNQETNNQEGYDIAYDYEHSIHNMIDLICNPKYVQLKDSILQNMENMVKNPKMNTSTKEKVQNVLDSDIFNKLCYPIEPTDATITTEGVMSDKQRKIWNKKERRFWNSMHSRRRIKNPNVTKANQVQNPIYGINGITLIHPEGSVDDRGTGLPFITHAEPNQSQIIHRWRRLVNNEIQALRSSSSLGGTKKQNKKRKRKTRKIV